MGSIAGAPTLTDEQRAAFFALTKGADTVELKLTMPLSDRSRAGSTLGVDPIDGQIRQVYFFDTPDLTLNKCGVVLRARLRGHWTSDDDPQEDAKRLYSRFLHEPLPLGT